MPPRSSILGAAVARAIVATVLIPGLAGAAPRPLQDRAAQVVSAMRPIGGLGCESHGTGLAVGGGLVLTAAHVLFDRADIVASCKLPQWARDRFATRAGDPFALRVAVRGRPAGPASLVASGRRDGSAKAMVFTGSGDFAILRVAAVSAGEDLVACDGIPAPNRAVTVLLSTGAVETTIAATQSAKSGEDAGYIDLAHVFTEGDSGAGVIDAATSCVWGVISHGYREPAPTVTRMTPVGVFAAAWKRARSG